MEDSWGFEKSEGYGEKKADASVFDEMHLGAGRVDQDRKFGSWGRLLKPVDEAWKIVVHVSGIAPIPEDPDWQQQQDRQCRPAEGASLKRGRCKIGDINDGSRQEAIQV